MGGCWVSVLWCLLLFADLFVWVCCFESDWCFCLFVIDAFGMVGLQRVDVVVVLF